MEDKLPRVKSLAKALSLLECFSVQEPELGVSELADKMNITKSNAHNIVSTFHQLGYIKRSQNGRYSLDIKMLRFSFIINQSLGYPRAVYDIITETAQRANQVVYFGVPFGSEVLYLYVAHPLSRLEELPYRQIMGEVAPLYSTGIGKAILAHLPESEWESRLPSHMEQRTPNTITDHAAILNELMDTRTRGFSIDNGENEVGIRCVGVPVYNVAGQLVAGMSTSGPKQVMTDEKLMECVVYLRNASMKMKDRIYH